MKDRVIDLIYHYYMTMTLLHARITPFRLYKHQWNESFNVFMAQAKRIITSANIPMLNMNQLSILAHVDMMTNKVLLEEIYKVFNEIFAKTYTEAIAEIRKIHYRLMTLKTKRYDRHGEGDRPISPQRGAHSQKKT